MIHLAILFEEGTNPIEFSYIRLRMAEEAVRTTIITMRAFSHLLEDRVNYGRADTFIDDVDIDGFDGVLIPGGTGPEKLRTDNKIVELVKRCYEKNKVCAAICHGQQVFISAGFMKGKKATSAWSMMDDLREVGAFVPEGERVVRDENIVTAIFPNDLPEFCKTVLKTLSETEGYSLTGGYPSRLEGQTWGMLADNAADSVQIKYLKPRFEEEGGRLLLLGRKAGMQIDLSSDLYEWGDMGMKAVIDCALPDSGTSDSCDNEAESNDHSISSEQLDGIIIPGGLGISMLRGHKGFRRLAREMNEEGKPICTIERGAKALFMTGILKGRTITCDARMKDDVIYSTENIKYSDECCVVDGNIISCRGTDDIPLMMRKILAV